MSDERSVQQRVADVKDRITIVGVISRHVKLRRFGREHVGLCPFHNEKTPSFTVNEDKGFFHCFGCGRHGDAIDFVRHLKGADFFSALEEVEGLNGAVVLSAARSPSARSPAGVAHSNSDDEQRRIAYARELWHSAKPAAGTLAEIYLHSRGIHIPIPASLRYLAAAKHAPTDLLLPVMLGAVQGPDGQARGVHRTYLSQDGTRKAGVAQPKMMLGRIAGGAVRLKPAGPKLAIAEGIETGLSIAQACPGLPVWAALSASIMQLLVLPAEVCEVVLCCDGDEPGQEAARVAAKRFLAEGRVVRITSAPEGEDFNDVLRRVG